MPSETSGACSLARGLRVPRDTGLCPEGLSRRMVYEYLKWAREAIPRFGTEFLGMIRPVGANTKRRLSDEHVELLSEIVQAYCTGRRFGVRRGSREHRPVPGRRLRLPMPTMCGARTSVGSSPYAQQDVASGPQDRLA